MPGLDLAKLSTTEPNREYVCLCAKFYWILIMQDAFTRSASSLAPSQFDLKIICFNQPEPMFKDGNYFTHLDLNVRPQLYFLVIIYVKL